MGATRKTGSIVSFSSTASWTGTPRKTHRATATATAGELARRDA
jgi:hypothetical protein